MEQVAEKLATIARELRAVGNVARELHTSIHHETGRTQTQEAIAERVDSLTKQIDSVYALAEEAKADVVGEHVEGDDDDQGDDQGDDDEGEHAEGAARPERARANARKRR